MKRTALVRRTRLQAKKSLNAYHLDRLRKEQKAEHRPNLRRSEVDPEVREQVIREHPWCQGCHRGRRSSAEPLDVHHAFYRSHASKRIRHERWNLVVMHRGCHDLAHTDPHKRNLLEQIALRALYEFLGPWDVREVMKLVPAGATDPAAFVRAYERFRRG